VEINRLLHNPAYPKEPKTLGERIRKARMDEGLLIRELAALVGVTADTVINWELRGVKPMGRRLRRPQEALEGIASGVEGS
jgi:DNA-binding transcriptional regulator YiaG